MKNLIEIEQEMLANLETAVQNYRAALVRQNIPPLLIELYVRRYRRGYERALQQRYWSQGFIQSLKPVRNLTGVFSAAKDGMAEAYSKGHKQMAKSLGFE